MNTIGYILTSAALVAAILQIRKTLKVRTIDGLSGATTLAWVASWTVWVVYGFLVESGPVVLRNFVGLIPASVMLFVFLKFGKIKNLVGIVSLYAAALGIMLYDLEKGVLVMVCIDIVFYAPSIVAAFRSKDLKGVSVLSNNTQCVLTGAWFMFMVLDGQALAGINWAVGAITYFVVFMRVLHSRRAAKQQIVYTPSVLDVFDKPLTPVETKKPVLV
jgi:uncharacterized protein with PQ loop repeat